MNEYMIKILIPAVGGQGGGILTEWLYQSFLIEGYEVQTISLPGLAQRTGSTVYYVEAYKDNDSVDKQIFSQHPVPGDIDIIISQEFLELGRILEQGYGSEKTKILSSTHRVYSTLEKLPVAKGVYSQEQLILIADEFSSEFMGIDALGIAKNYGLNELGVNAILFGVLSETCFLPFKKSTFTESIKRGGVAVESNLQAFEIGAGYFTDKINGKSSKNPDVLELTAGKLGIKLSENDKKGLILLIDNFRKTCPKHLLEFISEALVRLTDYQDFSYAKKYAEKVEDVMQYDKSHPDNDFRLSEIFVKNLALLMSYEDGIRVAELKIRSSRFKKIKDDMKITDDQLFRVRDYLKPDAEEVYGLFPDFIVSPVLKISDKLKLSPKKPFMISQKPETTSFSGFLRLWFLSRFKFSRRYSYRFKKENQNIMKYIEYVNKYSSVDYDLGCLVAKSGSIIKGYGKVRRRTVNTFNSFLKDIVDGACNSRDLNETKKIVEKSIELLSGDESGIEDAKKLVFPTAV